jgi:hypothetical protein
MYDPTRSTPRSRCFSAACSAAEGPQIPSEDAKRVGDGSEIPHLYFHPEELFYLRR